MPYYEHGTDTQTKTGGALVGKTKISTHYNSGIQPDSDPTLTAQATLINAAQQGGATIPDLPPPPPNPARGAGASGDLLFGFPRKQVYIAGGIAAGAIALAMLLRK